MVGDLANTAICPKCLNSTLLFNKDKGKVACYECGFSTDVRVEE